MLSYTRAYYNMPCCATLGILIVRASKNEGMKIRARANDEVEHTGVLYYTILCYAKTRAMKTRAGADDEVEHTGEVGAQAEQLLVLTYIIQCSIVQYNMIQYSIM